LVGGKNSNPTFSKIQAVECVVEEQRGGHGADTLIPFVWAANKNAQQGFALIAIDGVELYDTGGRNLGADCCGELRTFAAALEISNHTS